MNAILPPLGRRAAAAALGVVTLLALAGRVAGHGPDPILDGGLYAQDASLEFRWDPDGVPPSPVRAAVVDAAGEANETTAARTPSFALDSTAPSDVYYGTDVPCGTNGIACMRRYPPDGFGVWFRPQNTKFDWGSLTWCELSGYPDGCFEVENVMLDELGHVMVLDHHVNFTDGSDYRDAVVQTVSRTKPKSGWNAHAYARCDVATLQRQYDVPLPTTPYSTCTTLSTVMTLSSSRTSAPAGWIVTFSATFKVGSGYGRLSSNPLDGRRVVLQRRASSTSGWSDVATMSTGAAAGSYTLNLGIWSSADYRAVYRKTSSEGLGTSTSSIVTVVLAEPCTRAPCPLSATGGGR